LESITPSYYIKASKTYTSKRNRNSFLQLGSIGEMHISHLTAFFLSIFLNS